MALLITYLPISVRNDGQPIAHFVTSLPKIDGIPEPIEVHIIISCVTEPKDTDDKKKSEDLEYRFKPGPFLHAMTTNLSDANKQGLDSLAYWRNGPKASKVYILNQALAQYLAQHKESQWPIPPDEAT